MYIEGQDEADSDVDAGFDTAFAEFAKGSPPPDEDGRDDSEPPAEQEPAPAGGDEPPAPNPGAAAPAEDTSSDPWKDAPAALIAERDRLIAERDRAVHSDLSQRGRIAALQRKVVAPAPTPPAASPPQDSADGEADKAKADRLKQLREDYPDVAGPILELIEAQQAKIDGMASSVDAVSADREAATEAAQLSALEHVHPDFREIAKSQDFAAWVETQPETVQALVGSADAREVSAALTLFKTGQPAAAPAAPAAAATPTSDRRSRQMEGNRAVTSRTPPAASGAPADFDDAFAYFAKQKAAQK